MIFFALDTSRTELTNQFLRAGGLTQSNPYLEWSTVFETEYNRNIYPALIRRNLSPETATRELQS